MSRAGAAALPAAPPSTRWRWRWRTLRELDRWLETPVMVLGLLWAALFVAQVALPASPALEGL